MKKLRETKGVRHSVGSIFCISVRSACILDRILDLSYTRIRAGSLKCQCLSVPINIINHHPDADAGVELQNAGTAKRASALAGLVYKEEQGGGNHLVDRDLLLL